MTNKKTRIRQRKKLRLYKKKKTKNIFIDEMAITKLNFFQLKIMKLSKFFLGRRNQYFQLLFNYIFIRIKARQFQRGIF